MSYWDAEPADKPDSVNATRAAPDNHSSRRRITTPLKLPTRRLPGAPLPAPAQGECRSPAYLELLRVEVTVPCALPHAAVRSYRTVSPLPDPPGLRQGPSAVCSLLPCSASHDGWPLAITLPYGVRTFLPLPMGGGDCLADSAGRSVSREAPSSPVRTACRHRAASPLHPRLRLGASPFCRRPGRNTDRSR